MSMHDPPIHNFKEIHHTTMLFVEQMKLASNVKVVYAEVRKDGIE